VVEWQRGGAELFVDCGEAVIGYGRRGGGICYLVFVY